MYENYKVNIPEGRIGSWEVDTFVVEENDLRRMRYALQGRSVPPGRYTRLTHNGCVIMSDTPAEIRDQVEVIRKAQGRVLLNGLGLGVVLKAILQKPEVISVDIVEKSSEVIQLVGQYYTNPRVTIFQDDALTIHWEKGAYWDVIWHDIWPDICADNLPEMKKLHYKYGKRCAWQGSWCRRACQSLAKGETNKRYIIYKGM